MFTYHQNCSLAFTKEQFHEKCSCNLYLEITLPQLLPHISGANMLISEYQCHVLYVGTFGWKGQTTRKLHILLHLPNGNWISKSLAIEFGKSIVYTAIVGQVWPPLNTEHNTTHNKYHCFIIYPKTMASESYLWFDYANEIKYKCSCSHRKKNLSADNTCISVIMYSMLSCKFLGNG